jgi:4-hydroxy-4-methyl-2-oxoglutarate aldolase
MEFRQEGKAEISVQDMYDRFGRIYTGAISDVMGEMGYRDQVLPAAIQALRPDMRVSGVAMPIEGKAAPGLSRDDYFLPFLEMLGDLKPGHVIVSQPNDSLTAHLGELSAETAQFRGARGAVIDGGCRDIDYILKLGFSVFCRYHTPLDIVGRWQLKNYGKPVRIGRVTVREGDFIVGDKDGVLVIPKEISEEVLIKAEEAVSTENLIRKSILQGIHPVEAYKRHGRF